MTIKYVAYAIMALGLLTACGQNNTAPEIANEATETAVQTPTAIPKADSTEIANKIDDWNQGWKLKDHTLATKWYSDHAAFTNAFGHHKIGQKAIENFLSEVFQLPFVMAGDSNVTHQKMMVLGDNVVLVMTTIERTGQKSPDNQALGVRKTTHHRVFKKDKEWMLVGHLISDARDTESNKH